MVEKNFIITDEAGLHARPASILTKNVQNFQGNAYIKYGKKSGNLKSIMSIMALGITTGSEITICLEGMEEKEMIKSISQIFHSQNLVD